ncbi:MFS family permease [Nonomuraea thailandensis]|uniref:MFS family permease n=1 Tax=Nonomuraea thailandensis TaxID=1188745 RepID=A0A9X2K864_9ACTN|nr:MFS transporter [Nonomuraea thailandensis]MCP2363818.1 MFS family permease [Nonomuraea thailandensis]
MSSATPAVLPRRGSAALIASVVLASIGSGLFMPLSIVYFTALSSVPLPLLGTLLGAANLITVPIPLWAGLLADRFGARPLVIVAQLLQALSFLAYVRVHEPVGIFLASSVGAVGVRLYWSSIFTLIADHADHHRSAGKDLWYARANIARTVGIGAGGFITGLVITDGRPAAYHAIAYASFACFLLAALALAALLRLPHRPDPDAPPVAGYRAMARDRAFMGLTALNVIYALSTLMLGLALPTFIRTALSGPAWLTSVVLVGNAVLITASGSVLTRRLSGLRRTRVLCVAAALWSGWGLSLAAIAQGRGAWAAAVLVIATLLFTIAEIMHAPASMALAAAISPDRARGRYLAMFQYSFIAAEIIAPIFFTTLFDRGHAVPFLALAVANGVAIVCGIRLERHLPPHALHPSPQPPPGDRDGAAASETPSRSGGRAPV